MQTYYSTYNNLYIEAENEDETVLKARREARDNDELLGNLEHWEEADVVATSWEKE